MVSTEQSPRPWHFWASSRVDMIRPLWPENVGEPEIRVVDGKYRDSPIYAYATNSARSRDEVVSSHGQLIVATGPAAPGDGWSVRHYPEPADDPVCIPFPSKAAARSEVRRLARGYARLFKVKVRMVD
jgi:hypothetical protein